MKNHIMRSAETKGGHECRKTNIKRALDREAAKKQMLMKLTIREASPNTLMSAFFWHQMSNFFSSLRGNTKEKLELESIPFGTYKFWCNQHNHT